MNVKLSTNFCFLFSCISSVFYLVDGVIFFFKERIINDCLMYRIATVQMCAMGVYSNT